MSLQKRSPYQYVLKKNYISIIINGRPFQLDDSHPTFSRLKEAIERENWSVVPKLVNVSEYVAELRIDGYQVFYRDIELNNSLIEEAIKLIKAGATPKRAIDMIENFYVEEVLKKLDRGE